MHYNLPSVIQSRFRVWTGAPRLGLTFPNHQINQDGDEAHGDDGEHDHQALRRVLKLVLFLRAAREVDGVDAHEVVLNVRVWVEAANYSSHILDAHCQLVVRSVWVKRSQWLMSN